MALNEKDRQQFLSEPHIAALSVESGGDRAPLTVPIWYQYTPGGQPWVLTGKTSKKAELIRAAGRFTLMVERLEPTIRYVSVDGVVDRIEDGTSAQLREMSARYLAPEKVDGYLEFAESQLEENIAIYLRPEHWLSADLGQV